MSRFGTTWTSNKEASRAMARAARQGGAEVLKAYVRHIRDIDAPSTNYMLKSEVFCEEDLDNYANSVRFSCIFNDVTYFCFKGGCQLSMRLIMPEGFKKAFGNDQLTLSIPVAEIEKAGFRADQLGEMSICPSFAMRSDEIIVPVLKSLVPFIASGRLVVRPARLIGLQDNQQTKFLGVRRDNPLDMWEIGSTLGVGDRPTSICMESAKDDQESEMFKICIPFIDGVTFKDLNSIINDEFDHIGALRASLGEIVRQAKQNNNNIREIVRDVLNPKLDHLGRRFKIITSMHRSKLIGASVCTAVLSFLAAKTSGADALAIVLGTGGGLGYWLREKAEFFGRRAELKRGSFVFPLAMSRNAIFEVICRTLGNLGEAIVPAGSNSGTL